MRLGPPNWRRGVSAFYLPPLLNYYTVSPLYVVGGPYRLVA